MVQIIARHLLTRDTTGWQIMVVKNKKGMATIEALPLIVIFMMMMSYGVGLFGAVHTAILNSIGARTYAFETFKHRTNLVYFRNNRGHKDHRHFLNIQSRVHGVTSDKSPGGSINLKASLRPIAFGQRIKQEQNQEPVHNAEVHNLDAINRKVGVNPIWIMVSYGICITPVCGGEQSQ